MLSGIFCAAAVCHYVAILLAVASIKKWIGFVRKQRGTLMEAMKRLTVKKTIDIRLKGSSNSGIG
jgi:hypothetical protein